MTKKQNKQDAGQSHVVACGRAIHVTVHVVGRVRGCLSRVDGVRINSGKVNLVSIDNPREGCVVCAVFLGLGLF